MKYTWNISQWIYDYTPFRDVITLSFINSFLAPVKRLHNEFLEYISITDKKIVYGSQTIVLEFLLNEAFDRFHRIKIVNTGSLENKVYGKYPGEQPKAFGKYPGESDPVYGRFPNDQVSIYDFIIEIPDDVEYDHTELTALVESVKFMNVTYKITLVDE